MAFSPNQPKQQAVFDSQKRFILVMAGKQGGKGLVHGTGVLTPSGYVPVEGLQVGDKVVAGDGTITTVNGVFPQGVKKIYRVTFGSGDHLVTDGSHRWQVKKSGQTEWTVRSTEWLLGKKSVYVVPAPGVMAFQEKSVPIDPYTLGVLLGDGHSASNVGRPRISQGYPTSGLTDALTSLGLRPTTCSTKFVPDEYKFNSPDIRLQVLRGLMDTDGWTVPHKETAFCSTSKRLAEDVKFLVESLGGWAKLRTKQPRVGKLAYIVRMRCPTNPFWLERKAAKWTPLDTTARSFNKTIRSVEPAGEAETTCISVTADCHTFVAEGQVVTHNTTVGAAWLLREIWNNYQERIAQGDSAPRQWLICGPTHKNLNQGALPKMREFFPKDWGEWKEQKSCYELVWGDTIFVRSADDPDDIESMTLSGAWLDEFGRMDKSVWENIQARVIRYKARVIMTTTPYLRQFWMKQLVYDKASEVNGESTNNVENDPRIAVYKWKTVENPAIDSNEIEMARKSMSQEAYELAYEAEFTKPQGLVYKDFDLEDDVVTPFVIPSTWERFGGLDFGYGSITCLLSIAKKPEVRGEDGSIKEAAVFYVVREVYEKGLLLPALAKQIQASSLRYILYDPRGAQESAELSSHTFGIKGLKAADNGIEAGVDRLKVLFQEHRIKVFKTCKNFIEEICGYYNDEDGFPVKKNDHAMDALKYAFSRQMDGMFKQHHASVSYQFRKNLSKFKKNYDVNQYTGY